MTGYHILRRYANKNRDTPTPLWTLGCIERAPTNRGARVEVQDEDSAYKTSQANETASCGKQVLDAANCLVLLRDEEIEQKLDCRVQAFKGTHDSRDSGKEDPAQRAKRLSHDPPRQSQECGYRDAQENELHDTPAT